MASLSERRNRDVWTRRDAEGAGKTLLNNRYPRYAYFNNMYPRDVVEAAGETLLNKRSSRDVEALGKTRLSTIHEQKDGNAIEKKRTERDTEFIETRMAERDKQFIEMFGIKEVFHPSRSRRNYAIGVNVMVATNIAAALAFFAHAVYVTVVSGWTQFEVCEDVAIAFAYFIVGIVFPCVADSVADAVEVENLATLATHYCNALHENRQVGHSVRTRELASLNWVSVANSAWPCSFVLGLLSPLLVWANQLLSGCWYLGYGRVCFVFWIFGMLLLGSTKIADIGLDYANKAVDGLVREYGIAVHDLDWGILKAKTRMLDRILSDPFRLSTLGGLWASRIGVLFVIGLCFSGGSVAHPEQSMRIGCTIGAAIFGLGGTLLLLKLGSTTQKFTDTRPSSGSLVAALYDHFEYNRLQTSSRRELGVFFANRKMGIDISGVLITQDVAAMIGLRLCVYVPVASALVGSLLI